MANGRVITGFSYPYVALYGLDGNNDLDYSSPSVLARGVDVTITPNTSDNNNYYGDNEIIESDGGTFTGGTVTLHVDGLLDAAEKLIFGLPAPDTITVDGNSVKAYRYGDAMSVPDVGLGFIVRYMSEGATTYVPIVLHRVRFNLEETSATTQGETIDWQSATLSAQIFRDGTASKNWKTVYEAQDTEAKAQAVIAAVLA